MSLRIPCPRCGVRPSEEFTFGGELRPLERRGPRRGLRARLPARERGGSAARAVVPCVRVSAVAHGDARHGDEPDRRAVTGALRVEGRRVAIEDGDTIASAMYRDGVRTFTRSLKYHRRRGLSCLSGDCPNCLVTVDGQPGVRACVTPAREGQDVRRVSGWPSAEHDALHVTDRLHRLMPVAFYSKTFIRPRFAWPLAERVIRRATGIGRLPAASAGAEKPVRAVHVDVLVVGGGVAGLAAAAEAATRRCDDAARRGARARLRNVGRRRARTDRRARRRGARGRRDDPSTPHGRRPLRGTVRAGGRPRRGPARRGRPRDRGDRRRGDPRRLPGQRPAGRVPRAGRRAPGRRARRGPRTPRGGRHVDRGGRRRGRDPPRGRHRGRGGRPGCRRRARRGEPPRRGRGDRVRRGPAQDRLRHARAVPRLVAPRRPAPHGHRGRGRRRR